MEENKKAAQKKKISHAIIMVVLILLFLMFIFPFILVIINAFKTKGDIMSDPMALVGSHGFIVTNFSDAMKKMNFTIVYQLTDHHSFSNNWNYSFVCNDRICNCKKQLEGM